MACHDDSTINIDLVIIIIIIIIIIHRSSRADRFVQFWASVEAKFSKMGYFLPWSPMNRRAKFDAASIILGEEIRNRTNTHTHTHTHNYKQ